jgi:hypothetical protein
LAGIQSKKISIQDSVLQEFDIDSKKYKSKIAPKIDAIEKESELELLLKSEKERKKFIKTIF